MLTNATKPKPVETVTAAGVTLLEWHFKAGETLISEVHTYDHLSILVSGTGILTVGEASRSITGPHTLEIKAGIVHAFYAVTDCIWDCIHAGDEPSVERNP